MTAGCGVSLRPRGAAAEQLHTTPALVASASFFCGEAAFRLGRHRLAVTHLTRVVESFPADPTFGSSLLRLGECLAELQHWPRCEQVLGDYLELFGRTANKSDQHGNGDLWFQAQFGVGWARENQGRYDEAIRAYEAVVLGHQGPTAARAQFQVGECLFAKKDYQAAAGEFLKVDILYAYPKWSAAALFEAGVCFEELSKPVEARTQFKTVAAKYEGTQWAKMASIRLAQVSDANPPGR